MNQTNSMTRLTRLLSTGTLAIVSFACLHAQPTTEWTLHKTEDGLHPDGNEQSLLWFMNRARSNPTAEGEFLAALTQANIVANYQFFGVDLEKVKTELAAFPPAAPGAFDRRLYAASKIHSDYMISVDEIAHEGNTDHVTQEGFAKSAQGGIFTLSTEADDLLSIHASLAVDWGDDGDGDNMVGDGIQESRTNRKGVFRSYSNFGTAIVPQTDTTKTVGPLVTSTANYYANPGAADHYNFFLVGTAWTDLNENDQYDPGEGHAGVTVMPNSGDFYATTSAGGGYAIPVNALGEYKLSFTGGDLIGTEVRYATVVGTSVLVSWNEHDSRALSDAPSRTPELELSNDGDNTIIKWEALWDHYYTLQMSSNLSVWADKEQEQESVGSTNTIEIPNEELSDAPFVRLKAERQ